MTSDTAQILTELFQLTTARQKAEEEHRARTAELDHLEQSLLSSITVSDLDDPSMRQAVAALSTSWDAGCLLSDWARGVRGAEFDLAYYRVPVTVRAGTDENSRASYRIEISTIPTLNRPPSFHLGPDGIRRPDPAAVERLESIIEKLCEGTGMVALNFDSLGYGEETIIRTDDGMWEHRGPAPYGVLLRRGTLYEAIRWHHRTVTNVEDGNDDLAWTTPGETLGEASPLPFWRG